MLHNDPQKIYSINSTPLRDSDLDDISPDNSPVVSPKNTKPLLGEQKRGDVVIDIPSLDKYEQARLNLKIKFDKKLESVITREDEDKIERERARANADLEKDIENAKLVEAGKLLGNGNDFPSYKYAAAATLVTVCVGVDVLYTVFLGKTVIDDAEYMADKTLNHTLRSVVVSAALPGLLSNLYCDETAVCIPNEAAFLALSESRFEKLFAEHPNFGSFSQKLTKALYYGSTAACVPGYLGLSTPDGVSLGLFTDNKYAIYAGCGVFGVSGTTYYMLFLNGKRADHIVDFVNLLHHPLNTFKTVASQPLMTLEAMYENALVISLRTLLAVYGTYVFGTETIKMRSGDPTLITSIATVGASTAIDALTTRTKKAFVENLQYSDISLKKLFDELSCIVPRTKSSKYAIDAFYSLVRGASGATAFYLAGWETAIAIGAAITAHALYAKTVKHYAQVWREIEKERALLGNENRSDDSVVESKQLSLAEQAEQEKEKLFQEIMSHYQKLPEFRRNRFAYNGLARFIRFLLFPITVHVANKQLNEWGAYDYLGLDSIDKVQELALTVFIGVPIYLKNELGVYADSLIEANAEQIARYNMQKSKPSHQQASFFGRVKGHVQIQFKPAQTFTNDELRVEAERLKELPATNEISRPKTSWLSIFNCRKTRVADERTVILPTSNLEQYQSVNDDSQVLNPDRFRCGIM